MEVVLATRNPHKLEEIRQILAAVPVTLLAAADLGAPDVEEDQPTLEGNAAKKARETARATGRFAVADDTGLLVDALGGRPGVLSARYAGAGATSADNVRKLLREMATVPVGARGARFECVIALARPDPAAAGGARDLGVLRGRLEGEIATEPRGAGGFGYDPVFVVAGDPQRRTLAELTADEKNRLSHRARALEKLKTVLPELVRRAAAVS